MISKILGVLVVLVLMASTGAVGFYYGGKVSPISTGLAALGEIAYDRAAEARFNTQIGILDAQLAEKEFALSEIERKNRVLELKVANNQSSYNSTMVKVEVKQEENQENFEFVSTDLERSIKDNSKAQDDLVELNNLFIGNVNLFQGQLEKANNYITVLEESNEGLVTENTLLKSINEQITQQNDIMRDRIDDISGSRIRHGPGFAMGFNPVDNYQLTMLVGWTVSWG